jgi:CheY-like chemotaxis protein
MLRSPIGTFPDPRWPFWATACRAPGVTLGDVSLAPDTRVLIVEDDPDICLLFATTLATRGFEVAIARNGEEALAALESGPLPAAIVADLHMPVMDGWELLIALRADPTVSSIPVIVLTAADDPGRQAPRPGTILIKPVSTETLIEAIHAAIATRAP